MPADGPVVQTVALAGVFKDYGEKRALSDVSLTLEAGQVLALLGENGAGKSTLLGVLAQQIRPTRGKLLFDGRDVSDLDGRWLRQNLSLLSHEPRCYADLSARENLTFFAKLYGVGSDEKIRAERVRELLERVGLSAAADRPSRTFSRGMVQRLAIARALVHRPGLLLLDEPYTGLDQEGVRLLSSLIADERARGAIVVVISHDFEPLAPLLDVAAVLRRGRLEKTQRYAVGECTRELLLQLYTRAAERPQARSA
ncbi:MAG: heme ABC exporter ATP-binding protein CcmA [Deltaproteobacteria bacterium]|jgi:heme exporter protein A|nr:heme ABC exporter ATP-binding protein CcmA [Deltaproteobacteria bacterium]